MAKTSKKALGATMAGVMAVGAIAGAVNAVDQVKVANAAESQALKDAKAKISHLTWSLKNNYLGLKNQGQWEVYIKEAKALIAKMPSAEKAQADALTAEVNRDQELVNALARINQVEKSYEANYHGIKNAEQWRAYLDLATESLKSVDQKEFADQYAELVSRLNVASDNVKKIEDDYKVELDAATKLYDDAKASMNLEDAKKALTAAEALGTHATSDALEANIKALIAQIEKVDVEVKTISIDAKTYDDNIKNQRLSIKVNGESMNIDFLKAAGYTLKFSATESGKTTDAKIFAADSATSDSGKLKDILLKGDYDVQVTATKGGSIVISDKATVKVRNLDSTASTISKAELTANGVVLNSTTLVTGEKADFTKVEVKDGSSDTDVTANIKVESSNEAVISVASNGELTAQTPGTATITVSYGNVTKTISMTVSNSARKVAKVTPVDASVTSIVTGTSASTKVKVVDQYGDPIKDAELVADGSANDKGNKIGHVVPTDIMDLKGVDDSTAVAVSDEKGEIKLTVKATDAGNGTILFKNESGIIGRIAVTTTKTDNIASTKLEIVKNANDEKTSDDYTINRTATNDKDTELVLALNHYTSQGVENGKVTLSSANVELGKGLTATYVNGNAVIVANSDAKAGDYSVVVTDDKGKKHTATVKVVVSEAISIKNVTWTSVTPVQGDKITAFDVLSLEKTSAAPIMKSVTLNSSSAHKVRVVSVADATQTTGVSGVAGDIFLDKNDDGIYNTGDTKLGELKVKTTNAAITTSGAFDEITINTDNKGTIIYYINVDGDNDGLFNDMFSSTGNVVVK